MTPDTLVRTSLDGAVATLTLDSPHNRNALSAALIEQLLAGLAAAEQDDDVRLILLSHTGRVFCSGADLKETSAAFSGVMPPSISISIGRPRASARTLRSFSTAL